MQMLFGMWTRLGAVNYALDGCPHPPWVGTFEGDDVGIFLHAVNQRSNWHTSKAAECHITFSQHKIPLRLPIIKILGLLVTYY